MAGCLTASLHPVITFPHLLGLNHQQKGYHYPDPHMIANPYSLFYRHQVEKACSVGKRTKI